MEPVPVAERVRPTSGTTTPTTQPAPDGAATQTADRCPFPHGGTPEPVEPAPEPARCPVPHGLTAALPAVGCPVAHVGDPAGRSKADLVVRRILRIPDLAPGVSHAAAYRTFQKSMLISATRCTLTYVVFPFLLPFLHILKGGAPVIGILVGTVALVSDTFTIRRFFAVDHKWRWYFSGLAFAVMCLLSVLLVQDITDLVSHLT